MIKKDAYLLNQREKEFLELISQNGFEYNFSTNSVVVVGLTDPEIATKLSSNSKTYLIIPEDSGRESDVKRRERQRLRNLANSF